MSNDQNPLPSDEDIVDGIMNDEPTQEPTAEHEGQCNCAACRCTRGEMTEEEKAEALLQNGYIDFDEEELYNNEILPLIKKIEELASGRISYVMRFTYVQRTRGEMVETKSGAVIKALTPELAALAHLVPVAEDPLSCPDPLLGVSVQKLLLRAREELGGLGARTIPELNEKVDAHLEELKEEHAKLEAERAKTPSAQD